MSKEIMVFRQVFSKVLEYAPDAPEFDELAATKLEPPKPQNGSGRQWAFAIGLAAVALAFLPVVLFIDTPTDNDSSVWFTGMAGGSTKTGWLSQTPGEFILEVDGVRLVGSTTDSGVAPYGDAAIIEVNDQLTVTGAAAIVGKTDEWAVLTAALGEEVDVLDVTVGDSTENSMERSIDGTVVVVVPAAGWEVGDPPVLKVTALSSEGDQVAEVFVRAFPLGQVYCGNVTETATPQGGELTESVFGTSIDSPVTLLPLRPACPDDQPR